MLTNWSQAAQWPLSESLASDEPPKFKNRQKTRASKLSENKMGSNECQDEARQREEDKTGQERRPCQPKTV